ncbi:hypothetical protein [Rhodoblastus sp.]|uniref:hypothetical protein n=1 Tax=Rhodoblastus sp. TaxID=1962975 RepID=UPI003F9D930A
MNAIALKLALPKGAHHYWQVMCERTKSAGGFTVTDIHKSSNGVTRAAVWIYVQGCLAQGFVEKVGAKAARSSIFKVTTPRRDAPKIHAVDGLMGRRRQQLWTAIRAMPNFQLRELAVAASVEEVEISYGTAQRFIWQLRDAGMVELLDDGGKNAPSTFRLKRKANTGPLAPRIFDARVVFDPNAQKIVGEAIASEVLS